MTPHAPTTPLHCPGCGKRWPAARSQGEGWYLYCARCGATWHFTSPTLHRQLRERAIAAAAAIHAHEAEHGKARSAKIRRLEDRLQQACDLAGICGAEALSVARDRRG